jgi:hypothetical protein
LRDAFVFGRLEGCELARVQVRDLRESSRQTRCIGQRRMERDDGSDVVAVRLIELIELILIRAGRSLEAVQPLANRRPELVSDFLRVLRLDPTNVRGVFYELAKDVCKLVVRDSADLRGLEPLTCEIVCLLAELLGLGVVACDRLTN